VEGGVTVHTVADAPVPTQSPTRFTEPYGNDAAYIAALAAAYKDFASEIIAYREGKEFTPEGVNVDTALRVASFNDLAYRSMVFTSEGRQEKWTNFRVPDVVVLS
jgi:hypothetical protein